MKVKITNTQSGVSAIVSLPMKEIELLDITSDVLGRDEEGYILEDQDYDAVDENGKEVESIFDLNNSLQ